jgi:hypothetical protein
MRCVNNERPTLDVVGVGGGGAAGGGVCAELARLLTVIECSDDIYVCMLQAQNVPCLSRAMVCTADRSTVRLLFC